MILIEGTNLIEAACHADYKLEIIFSTESWRENHQPLCRTIAAKNFKTQAVSSEVLKAIATTVNPDGVVAIAPRPAVAQSDKVINRIGIALSTLQDPGNLGTIIRTVAATEADGIWLSANSVDVYSPKVLRASAGQWFNVPLFANQNLVELVKYQQQQGVQIIATSSSATKTYWEIDFTVPSLILFGNEGAGLSSELMEIADIQTRIPIAKQVESLNVSIAAALMLYEAQRQLTVNS